MAGQPILEVRHLNTYYRKQTAGPGGGSRRVQVLRDVSFDIYEGESVALVGESGSGKTTLCRAILGMLPDKTGEIVHHTERPQMVFQDPFSSLNPARTIGWTLEEALRAQEHCTPGLRRTRAQRRDMALEMLAQVGLDAEFYSRRPDALSGGQRQRVSIASAVITHPKLVLADEPVSALDLRLYRNGLFDQYPPEQEKITHPFGGISDKGVSYGFRGVSLGPRRQSYLQRHQRGLYRRQALGRRRPS